MGKRKAGLYDALDLASASDKRGPAATTSRPSINRWNGRPYTARYFGMLEKRRMLAVWQKKDEFVEALLRNRIVIVAGEVGSGKTTQIPQFVLQSVGPAVACTQPWRASAMAISQRVSEEMDVTMGNEVGYRVPFEVCLSEATVLKFLTDDMLLRETTQDPLLRRYNVVVVDEAHTRTLATDVLFVILKNAVRKRSDLKLVLMSNSCEAVRLMCFFTNAVTIQISPKFHPVETLYSDVPVQSYVEAAIGTALEVHKLQPAGDVHIFLPSELEVQYACREIRTELDILEDTVGPVNIIPLYSALPLELQAKIFEPAPVVWKVQSHPGRKIIVSTSIAETSFVMDGIVYVIDSGFVNLNFYYPDSGVESLLVSPISKASAQQRADCAGRTKPGVCFRLYTRTQFVQSVLLNTCTAISRSNLSDTVLTLKRLGVSDILQFRFMDAPAPRALSRSLEVLNFLGAVNDEGNLTPLGEMMGEFPVHPQMSKMILESPKFNCSNEIISICAMLLVPSCFMRPREAQEAADNARAQFAHIDGDHLQLLKVYTAYKQNQEDPNWCAMNFIDAEVMKCADNIRHQLVSIMTRFNIEMCSPARTNFAAYHNNIKLAMLSGYFMQVAHRETSGAYLTMKINQVVSPHPWTCLNRNPEWVMFYDSVGMTHIRTITDITGEMLLEVARRYYDLTTLESCEAKISLERLHLLLLTDSHPELNYLYHIPVHQLRLELQMFQWETVMPIDRAPREPEPERVREEASPP